MAKGSWYYEHYDEGGKLKRAKMNDYDGSIVGKIVFNLKAYFDENPGEAKRLGYIKHITHTTKEIKAMFPDLDRCSQYVVASVKVIDEHTVEDVYHVMDKSEEMMLHAELTNIGDVYVGDALYDFDDDEEDRIVWT